MPTQKPTPGTLLGLFMRRRGWSAPRLAEVAGGVSASSIRAYLADRTTPRPGHALALARALGPLDGKALLEAWEHPDLAEGFGEEWRAGSTDERVKRMTEAYYRFNRVEYQGEPLPEPAIAVVQALIEWLQRVQRSAQPTKPPRPPQP